MSRLQNTVAVVTGSSSGNGRAIALALAAEGACVVCSDIHREARQGGYETDADIATDDLIRQTGHAHHRTTGEFQPGVCATRTRVTTRRTDDDT